jgi:hypothetical protein
LRLAARVLVGVQTETVELVGDTGLGVVDDGRTSDVEADIEMAEFAIVVDKTSDEEETRLAELASEIVVVVLEETMSEDKAWDDDGVDELEAEVEITSLDVERTISDEDDEDDEVGTVFVEESDVVIAELETDVLEEDEETGIDEDDKATDVVDADEGEHWPKPFWHFLPQYASVEPLHR